MNGTEVPLSMAALAALPVVLLFALVVSGRVATHVASALVAASAVVIGTAAFGAGGSVLGVALGKGLWLGAWILAVVWPALLLYRVASTCGLDRIGQVFSGLLPRRRELLLLLAWVLPSFLQGVAGFGTPIAVAAPLLVAAGWSPVHAVASALVGYQWSVTFGSMGSSYFMAALTAQLDADGQLAFGTLAALLLAGDLLLAGALVLLMDGGLRGLREGGRMLLLTGVPMGAALVGTARVVPSVASLAAGTVGFASVLVLSALDRWRGTGSGEPAASRTTPAAAGAPAVAGGATDVAPPFGVTAGEEPGSAAPTVGRSLQLLSPYLILLLTTLPVFLVPSSRAWVRSHAVIAPAFPATTTDLGWVNAAVDGFTPLPLLGHPGTFVLVASVLGHLAYRRFGLWPAGPTTVVRDWLRSLPRSSASILLLAVLATVMADTGMVSVLARGVADAAGELYPALAPIVGGIGSFMTGSTTTSNALFSRLQVDVALLLDVQPELLLAAQTVGGNIGNALAPVVVLVGLTTIGRTDLLGGVLRRVLPAVGLLLLASAGAVALLA